MPGWLLENGTCVETCQIPGNSPNNDYTQCTNMAEFPIIYTPFSAISVVIFLMCIIVKKFKKETEIIPSVIALVSVIEFFMICF